MKGSARKYVDKKCPLRSTKCEYIYIYIYIYNIYIYIYIYICLLLLFKKTRHLGIVFISIIGLFRLFNLVRWNSNGRYIYISTKNKNFLVYWDYRNTPSAFLQRGKTPNKSSVLDMTLNLRVGSSNSGALGNVECPFIAIAPRSTLVLSGCT